MEIETIEDASAYIYDMRSQLCLLFPGSKAEDVYTSKNHVSVSLSVAHDIDLVVTANLPDAPMKGMPFRLDVELYICEANDCFWNFTYPLPPQEVYWLVAPAVRIAREWVLEDD